MKNANEQDLEQIEISLEQAKNKVAMHEALIRLKSNLDFKKLFLDGYLDKYVRRLVTLKTLMNMQGEKDQQYISGQISAIGFFDQYMILVAQEGFNAKNSIVADEEEQELILKEGLNNA